MNCVTVAASVMVTLTVTLVAGTPAGELPVHGLKGVGQAARLGPAAAAAFDPPYQLPAPPVPTMWKHTVLSVAAPHPPGRAPAQVGGNAAQSPAAAEREITRRWKVMVVTEAAVSAS